jgi:hypothetical protein
MKPLFQINRYALVMSAAGWSRAFPAHSFRRLFLTQGCITSVLDGDQALVGNHSTLSAGITSRVKRIITSPSGATVFCLLLLTTVLPLLNGAKAVLELVQSGGGLTGL